MGRRTGYVGTDAVVVVIDGWFKIVVVNAECDGLIIRKQ